MAELLKLKREWIGRRVRTRGDMRNGSVSIPAGTVLTVVGNRSGLKLHTDPCEHCGVGVYITRVSEQMVDLLPEESTDG